MNKKSLLYMMAGIDLMWIAVGLDIDTKTDNKLVIVPFRYKVV